MRDLSLKAVLLGLIVVFSPLMALAAEETTAQIFKKTCFASWMGRVDTISEKDKMVYQNYGDRYCSCVATQPLDSSAAINKAAQICMSKTLLHDTMDALADDVGLNELTLGDIAENCEDRWTLIYPAMNAADRSASLAYCGCAKPKLLSLSKNADKMTDQVYSNEIDTIAASCSQMVKADATTTGAAFKQ
jgi:hypothetical protein